MLFAMSKMAGNLRVGLAMVWLAACSSGSDQPAPPPPPPPPLPVAPVAPTPSAEQAQGDAKEGVDESAANDKGRAAPQKSHSTGEHDTAARDDVGKERDTGGSLYDLVKEGKATLPDSKPSASNGKVTASPITKPEPTKPEPAKPEPTKPEPAKPVGKVSIPSTANVRVDVPKGMQELLNKDPRMGPWVKQVVEIADKCYAQERKSNALAEGSIAVNVTMHENDRPDADVKSLPPQLSGVVACATGKLMRIKMPLFTGPEGQKHGVKIVFSK